MKPTIIILTAILLTALLTPPARAGGPLSWPGPFGAKQAYYTGVFDACMFALSQSGLSRQEAAGLCSLVEMQARAADWYHNRPDSWGLLRQPARLGNEA